MLWVSEWIVDEKDCRFEIVIVPCLNISREVQSLHTSHFIST